MAQKIFFSHSNKDIQIVRKIAQRLRKHRLDVYLYEDDPKAGGYIVEKIKDAIDEADCMLVLITKNSQGSAYVNQEIGIAEGWEKIIIPLVEVGIRKPNLAVLEGREYITIDFNDIDFSISQIRKTMDDVVEGYTAGDFLFGLSVIAILYKVFKNLK